MQELEGESADMALRESNRQIHSQRMELCHTNHVHENSPREQAWLQADVDNRERAHQETRIKTLQDVEEWKRISCTEAEENSRIQTRMIIPDKSCRKASPQCIS